MKNTRKNPAAASLGRLGAAARMRNMDEFRSAQAKGRASFERRFASEKERKAYYAEFSRKGLEARKAKKASKTPPLTA